MDIFIKDKYINKRWVDSKLKDPVVLYKTDTKRFEKYVEALYAGKNLEDEESDGEESEDSVERK